MNTFYSVLVNTLFSTLTCNFLWFALVFWAYLETQSVLVTAVIGGSYMLIAAGLGLVFGTFVDNHKKKTAMLVSSTVTLSAFSLAAVLYFSVPNADLLVITSVKFWIFVTLVLGGALAGNLRAIALSTTVTLLVPQERRDKANGMVGTVNGVAFAITSVFSGIVIGWFGMGAALVISLLLVVTTIAHLVLLVIREDAHPQHKDKPPVIDIHGALQAIRTTPGLLALILFTTINNLLNGVFVALLDPYGLTLMSVEAWGLLLGVLTVGYIIGGAVVAKRGLGATPLKTMFVANGMLWISAMIFPIKPSVILLGFGMITYFVLMPVIEAAEQTIIQKIVPFAKQGRVFGFAQSVESSAAPIMAFLIGPIAEFIVIPFMSSPQGVSIFGSWFGSGDNRAMAMVFIITSMAGLLVTVIAFRSQVYRRLAASYAS